VGNQPSGRQRRPAPLDLVLRSPATLMATSPAPTQNHALSRSQWMTTRAIDAVRAIHRINGLRVQLMRAGYVRQDGKPRGMTPDASGLSPRPTGHSGDQLTVLLHFDCEFLSRSDTGSRGAVDSGQFIVEALVEGSAGLPGQDLWSCVAGACLRDRTRLVIGTGRHAESSRIHVSRAFRHLATPAHA
jgi:hypothetical protein